MYTKTDVCSRDISITFSDRKTFLFFCNPLLSQPLHSRHTLLLLQANKTILTGRAAKRPETRQEAGRDGKDKPLNCLCGSAKRKETSACESRGGEVGVNNKALTIAAPFLPHMVNSTIITALCTRLSEITGVSYT